MYVKKFSQKIWKLLLDNKRQFYSINGRMMTLKSPKAVNRTFQVYQLNFSLARLFFKYEFTISLSVKRILSFNKRFLTKLICGLLQLFYLCQVSISFFAYDSNIIFDILSVQSIGIWNLELGQSWKHFKGNTLIRYYTNSWFLSTQRCIQNLFEHLKMELFAKIINGLRLFTIFAKSTILDVRLGSQFASVTDHWMRQKWYALPHLFAKHPFSNPWRHEKMLQFSDVFGG